MDGVGQLAQLVLERGDVAAQHAELGVTRGAGLLGAAAEGIGPLGGAGDDSGGVGGAHADRLGHLRLAQAALPPGLVPGPGVDLGHGRRLEGGRSVVQGAAPLLAGAQCES